MVRVCFRYAVPVSGCVSLITKRNRRIHFQSEFFGSFDAPWSERSWIDLFSKETENPFSDSFGFKNPILDFLKATHPLLRCACLCCAVPQSVLGCTCLCLAVHVFVTLCLSLLLRCACSGWTVPIFVGLCLLVLGCAVFVTLCLSLLRCACPCWAVPVGVWLCLSLLRCACPCWAVPIFVALRLSLLRCACPCWAVPIFVALCLIKVTVEWYHTLKMAASSSSSMIEWSRFDYFMITK